MTSARMDHHGADPSQHIYLNTHALGQPLCVIFGAYDDMLQNGKKWCKLALLLGAWGVACTMEVRAHQRRTNHPSEGHQKGYL